MTLSNIRVCKLLAGRQTCHVNELEKRTSTLWKGRFKASLVESGPYLLTCYRYIDLNPVRAGMVAAAKDYEWSSYRQHVAITGDERLDHSGAFLALGTTAVAHSVAYKHLASEGVGSAELAVIRTGVKRNQITGTTRFQKEIAKRFGQRTSSRAPGRPRVNR